MTGRDSLSPALPSSIYKQRQSVMCKGHEHANVVVFIQDTKAVQELALGRPNWMEYFGKMSAEYPQICMDCGAYSDYWNYWMPMQDGVRLKLMALLVAYDTHTRNGQAVSMAD